MCEDNNHIKHIWYDNDVLEFAKIVTTLMCNNFLKEEIKFWFYCSFQNEGSHNMEVFYTTLIINKHSKVISPNPLLKYFLHAKLLSDNFLMLLCSVLFDWNVVHDVAVCLRRTYQTFTLKGILNGSVALLDCVRRIFTRYEIRQVYERSTIVF